MDEQDLQKLAEDNAAQDGQAEAAPEDEIADGGAEDAGDGAEAKENGDTTTEEASQEDDRDARLRALEAENKRLLDKSANLKGKAEAFRRILKKQRDDGLLEEADIGGEGVDAKEVAVWIENGVDKDAVDAKLQHFDTQVKGALEYFTGQHGDVNQHIQAYALLLRDDPAERANLNEIPDAGVVDYIFRRAKEVAEEVVELKGEGGKALSVIRKLKKENAELKAKLDKGDAGGDGQPNVRTENKPSVNAPAVVTRQGQSVYADL